MTKEKPHVLHHTFIADRESNEAVIVTQDLADGRILKVQIAESPV